MSRDRAYENCLDHLAGDLRLASAPTTEIFANVINGACTRLPILSKAGKAARMRKLVEAGAQVDAALALIELELPQWRLRRLALDAAGGAVRYRDNLTCRSGWTIRQTGSTNILFWRC